MTTNNSAMNPIGDIIGLDVGSARIGVARINSVAKIAEPLAPIQVSQGDPMQAITALITEYDVVAIVVGLPRGLDGQETAQTASVREFAQKLQSSVNIPIYMIDEAGTSVEASEKAAGYASESIDSIAAAILLEDFIHHADKSALRIGQE